MIDKIYDYFKENYPYSKEFEGFQGEKRLLLMSYLSDWKHCLLFDKQISNFRWFKSHEIVSLDNVFELEN